MTWQERSSCGNDPSVSPADFFPEGLFVKNSPEYRAHVSKLKAMCGRCPVRKDCLEYADEHHEKQGIWGGLTAAQRKARKYPRGRVDGALIYLHKRAQ